MAANFQLALIRFFYFWWRRCAGQSISCMERFWNSHQFHPTSILIYRLGLSLLFETYVKNWASESKWAHACTLPTPCPRFAHPAPTPAWTGCGQGVDLSRTMSSKNTCTVHDLTVRKHEESVQSAKRAKSVQKCGNRKLCEKSAESAGLLGDTTALNIILTKQSN